MITIPEAKALARDLSRRSEMSRSAVLEAVAQATGHRDWNTFVAAASKTSTPPASPATTPATTSGDPVARQQVVPILRVFDPGIAHEFYCGFLGFEWVWQHQHEEDLPVYAQVERAGSVLHLSEHHGDATPGSAVMIVVDDLAGYRRQLLDQRHRNARPGITDEPWGTTMRIEDPFGNRLTFWQRPDH